MLIQTQNKLEAVSHPLITQMYLKKDFGAPFSRRNEDVLVIETGFPVDESDPKSFNTCLADLLNDLPSLQAQAEARVGPFDRIDIRTAH
ncbi:MAG: hypothetical protein H6865_04430 [Rhodospirillales bacterium]|nr:hypothetical protein [Alphaproteobacteria bacterium]MCB9986865.1 hypothetical protein [Rhodospirillales bacterium]USO08374.1 MAG: hypothetical protein H6866_03950 [Rhodospirillales bacterium]